MKNLELNIKKIEEKKEEIKNFLKKTFDIKYKRSYFKIIKLYSTKDIKAVSFSWIKTFSLQIVSYDNEDQFYLKATRYEPDFWYQLRYEEKNKIIDFIEKITGIKIDIEYKYNEKKELKKLYLEKPKTKKIIAKMKKLNYELIGSVLGKINWDDRRTNNKLMLHFHKKNYFLVNVFLNTEQKSYIDIESSGSVTFNMIREEGNKIRTMIEKIEKGSK